MASEERQINRWLNLQQPNPEFIKCVICNYYDYNEKYKKYYSNDVFNAGQLIRYQCPNCDLIFGDLRFLSLSDDEINNDYCDTYSYFSEGETTINIVNSLNSIEICKNKDFSYLDYACGIGKMIPILKYNNYNICGYDKYVVNMNVLNNIDNMKFDIIYSNNFIEHLINPIQDIKKMLKHLNINGYIIFISDCIDEYKNEHTHFHTYYYLGKSLKILCDNLGLKIIENKTIDPCRILVLQSFV